MSDQDAKRLSERLGPLMQELSALQAVARQLELQGGTQDASPVDDLKAQVEKLTQENMELASRLAEAEEMNAAMMNMYVSSHGLHASLDPARVVETIKEIVINFVGADQFAILLRHEETGDLDVVDGEEHQARYPAGTVEAQGVLGAVVASGEPFVHTEDESPREGILAAVPLAVDGRVVGAVVLFRLLQQKTRLEPADVELLHLLSTHSANALVNARLHARSERKLRTLESLMGMLRDGGRSSPDP